MLFATSRKSKPLISSQLVPGHPLGKDLVGCWLMNERGGRTVFDAGGQKNKGTFSGDPVWTPGKFGAGLDLDGTGDYVSIADPGSVFDGKCLTIVAWVYIDSLANSYPRIVDRVYNGQFAFYCHGVSSDLTWSLATVGGTKDYGDLSPVAVNTGEWFQAVLTYDGSNARIYRNGQLKDTYGTGISGGLAASSSDIRIGERADAGSTRCWDGKIDHVVLWNRALCASEIAQLYREPFAMFGRAVLIPATGSTVGVVNVAGSVSAQSSVTGRVRIAEKPPRVLQKKSWLKEALFAGMTANAFKFGTTLSGGWFWMRTTGCSALYRGPSMDEVDFSNILIVAEADARNISPPSYVPHEPNTTHFYVVRRFNLCGDQELTLGASAKVAIDATGELAKPQPNRMFDSRAAQVSTDKVRLVWFYSVLDQQSRPVKFNIYHDGGTGQIDYDNPAATVKYVGRRYYSYDSDSLSAGEYLFAIRAADVEGTENPCLGPIRIQVRGRGLQAIEILSVEAI